jgi:hypothetical protein
MTRGRGYREEGGDVETLNANTVMERGALERLYSPHNPKTPQLWPMGDLDVFDEI